VIQVSTAMGSNVGWAGEDSADALEPGVDEVIVADVVASKGVGLAEREGLEGDCRREAKAKRLLALSPESVVIADFFVGCNGGSHAVRAK